MLLCFVVVGLGAAGSAREVRPQNGHAIEVACHAIAERCFLLICTNMSVVITLINSMFG